MAKQALLSSKLRQVYVGATCKRLCWQNKVWPQLGLVDVLQQAQPASSSNNIAGAAGLNRRYCNRKQQARRRRLERATRADSLTRCSHLTTYCVAESGVDRHSTAPKRQRVPQLAWVELL